MLPDFLKHVKRLRCSPLNLTSFVLASEFWSLFSIFSPNPLISCEKNFHFWWIALFSWPTLSPWVFCPLASELSCSRGRVLYPVNKSLFICMSGKRFICWINLSPIPEGQMVKLSAGFVMSNHQLEEPVFSCYFHIVSGESEKTLTVTAMNSFSVIAYTPSLCIYMYFDSLVV